MNNKKLFNAIVKISLLSMVLMMSFQVLPVNAASLTGMSDTMSRLKAATLSSHTMRFTTPTGAGDLTDTIIITFPATFNFTSKTISTVSFTHGATTGAETTETLAAVPSATVWGAVFSGTENRIFTLTAPTDGIGTAVVAANDKIIITYDSTNSINASAGSYAIAISGTFGDTGSMVVSIIADEQVVVTGTVSPTFTFTVSDNTIGYGTLGSASARWATGDEAGNAAATVAHTMTVATNATDGYAVTFNGATLTSGSDTISVAAVTDDADGTPGNEEFGISIATSGDASITAGYAYTGTPDYKWVASTTTSIISEIVPTATETFSLYYLGNIATTTEPGTYTSTITYIATGTF